MIYPLFSFSLPNL